MKYSIALVICLSFINAIYPQSMLWKISGKGLEKPSFLYGTIHIQDKRVFAYGKEVSEAFEQSEVYAMEIVLDEISKEDMEPVIYMKKKNLKDLYTQEEYDLIDEYCQKKMGVDLSFLGKMKPFFLSSQLMQIDMPKDMDRPLDADFLKKARQLGKKIVGIEKLKDQMAAIDQISIKEQAELLLKGVQDSVNNMEVFENLVKAYLHFDFESIQTLLSDTTLPEKFQEALLIKRNKKMARHIAKIAKKNSSFNAIGAAHLWGEKGVIELLRKKGYTVEPIPFKFNN